MAESTKIEWCDHTFSPWRGCTKVASGCTNCFAAAFSKRNPGTLGVWGDAGSRVVASEAMWRQPVKWNKTAGLLPDKIVKPGSLPIEYLSVPRQRVFCASMCDVFEDWKGVIVNSRGETLFDDRYCKWSTDSGDKEGHRRLATLDDVRGRLFALIDATPNLGWLVLTKRPENVRRMWPIVGTGIVPPPDLEKPFANELAGKRRRQNVWLGTSIACQEDADRNAIHLRNCRDIAAKTFLSVEPLVGPVDLRRVYVGDQSQMNVDVLSWVDWVIVGGESGPNARPCRVEWIRDIVAQCKAAGTPVFVKQLGANVVTRDDAIEDVFNDGQIGWPDPDVEHDIHGFRESHQGADCRIRLRDAKGGDWSEWPKDLRIREFPNDNVTKGSACRTS